MKTINILRTWAPALIAALIAFNATGAEANMTTKPLKVVLVGASIGQDWNLSNLPKRASVPGYEFEALQAWQYDKTELLGETLMRPARKFRLTPSYFKGLLKPPPQPADIVVLKECSSYFPGELSLQRKQEMIDAWVKQVRDRNIKVMIATVAPVTKARAVTDPGKQESLRAFNDWVRDYARKNQIALLDLEAALRSDNRDRYLRDDLTSGDGSHLNRKAYDILDGVMAQALCQLQPGVSCDAKQVATR